MLDGWPAALVRRSGLHVDDIDYGRRRVVVRHREDHPRGVRSKSRTERVVDLHEGAALTALSAYVMGERPREADTPLVFVVGGNTRRCCEPLGYPALARLFARAATRAGIRAPWVTPHALRHTHATRMWERGMRELTLQRRLGHASPESTPPSTHTRCGTEVLADYRRALGSAIHVTAVVALPGTGTYAARNSSGVRCVPRRQSRCSRCRSTPAGCSSAVRGAVSRPGGLVRRSAGVPGRSAGRTRAIVTDVRSYEARPYLMFLGITGHARLDWPWLLAVGQLTVQDVAHQAGVDLGIDALVTHACGSVTALMLPGWSSAGWSAAS